MASLETFLTELTRTETRRAWEETERAWEDESRRALEEADALRDVLESRTMTLMSSIVACIRRNVQRRLALDHLARLLDAAARRLSLALLAGGTDTRQVEYAAEDTPAPRALAPPGRTIASVPLVSHAPPAWWASAAA